MGDSLKDQLLKLGIAKEKPASRGDERARAKQGGARRRDGSPPRATSTARSSTGAHSAGGAKATDATRAAPRVDGAAHARPSLHTQRQADRERSARQARVLERIEASKLDDAQAEIRHYYSTGRKIKWLYVTESQQAALLRGEIVIAIAQGKGRLVAASLVASLREIDPELRVVDPSRASEGDGDPAHDVPDDLRW